MDKLCRPIGLLIILFTTVGLAQDRSLSVVVAENAVRVNLRSAPTARRRTILGNIPRGRRLPLVGQTDAWYQVRLEDGSEAWISRAYARVEKLEDPFWIVDESSPLRRTPSEDAPEVCPVSKGELARRTGQEGPWCRIELADGSAGWIPTSSVVSALPNGSSTVAPAEAADAPDESGAPTGDISPQPQESSAQQPGTPASPGEEKPGPTASADRSAQVPPTSAEPEEPEIAPTRRVEPAIARKSAPSTPSSSSGFLVLSVAFGVLATILLGAGYWWFRRRRVSEIEKLIRAGQVVGDGVSGDQFLKNLRDAEARQVQLEKDLQRRLAALRETIGPGGLSGDSDEQLAVGRIEDIRKLVLEQQAKVNALSDLLTLQNQKLAAAEEENRLLRQLLPRS